MAFLRTSDSIALHTDQHRCSLSGIDSHLPHGLGVAREMRDICIRSIKRRDVADDHFKLGMCPTNISKWSSRRRGTYSMT
jgi:hypothetical protein